MSVVLAKDYANKTAASVLSFGIGSPALNGHVDGALIRLFTLAVPVNAPGQTMPFSLHACLPACLPTYLPREPRHNAMAEEGTMYNKKRGFTTVEAIGANTVGKGGIVPLSISPRTCRNPQTRPNVHQGARARAPPYARKGNRVCGV